MKYRLRRGVCCAKSFDTQRFQLSQWTAPIHRFLLEGQSAKEEVTKQYKQDLQERWMLKRTEEDRFKAFNKFHGKHIELKFAYWLEVHLNWDITGLEALGSFNDIQCIWRPRILKSRLVAGSVAKGILAINGISARRRRKAFLNQLDSL